MATYDATSEVKTLIAAGMTLPEINAALGYSSGAVTEDGRGGYDVSGRRVQVKLDELVAQRAQPAAPAPTVSETGVPMATEKQVQYALSLARKNAPGSFGASAETLRKMTRREISRVIDSLKTEW